MAAPLNFLPYKNQSGLWKHMATQCAVPLLSSDEYHFREDRLKEILREVNEGGYSPSKPLGFLSAPKQHSVARFVPVFSYKDTAVYFSCLQCVDQKLAEAAVEHTFGGWKLGGARRADEERQALELFNGEDSESIPLSCYNRGAWVQAWNQFWKLIAANHEHADDQAWFAMFDIANFYDSVDLHRLENSVRAASAGCQFPMNVLFHLLRTWNKGRCLYSESTKGLPMDVVGDCSRLLANFYLTAFDTKFREDAISSGGDYMRYADDMVIRAGSEAICKELVYRASERLHGLGLNINVAKVRYCSKSAFNSYWGFVAMDRFESDDLEGGMTMLRSIIQNEEFGRKPTALKRAITLVSKSSSPDIQKWRNWTRERAISDGLPLHLSREQILSFIRLYDRPAIALELLVPLFINQPFSQPKAVFVRALQSFKGPAAEQVSDYRDAMYAHIVELRDPVLDLCIAAA